MGAALGGLVILLGAFGLVNRLRGRPFWSLPDAFLALVGALFVVTDSVFVAAQLPRGPRADARDGRLVRARSEYLKVRGA